MKAILLALVAVLALSIAYYFAIALPSYNNSRLALEQQKYADEQRRMKEQEEGKKAAELEREMSLQGCLDDADKSYWTYVKLNGTDKGGGTYTAARSTWDVAEKNKQTEIENCYRRYPAIR
jgi:hypothetical protein